MSADRELLEAAAKAIGLPEPDGFHSTAGLVWIKRADGVRRETCWNSLADDGDALRLAVKLGIGLGIDMQDEIVTAYAPNPSPQHFSEDAHEVDHYAATRRAITCAAAAIGGAA